jgi:hypothetical protein
MSKKQNVYGYSFTTTNEVKEINNSHAVNFVLKYMAHYLEPTKFDGELVKNNVADNCNVSIKDEGEEIAIYLNDEKHISLNKNGFHAAKLHTELFSYAHGYFFTVIHNIKVNGVDLMKHHLQIN